MIIYPASWAIFVKIWKKHGIEWSEVEEIFEDERETRVRLLTAKDQHGQRRYKALGKTYAGHFITVVFVIEKKNRIKVITARKMDSREKKEFKKGRK